jgi:hypothetical protein
VSSTIQRPLFFENQILGAADLTASVDNSRGQEARHNRYLHLWGIAFGLELNSQPDPDKGDPFIKITLSAGMAIDGTGREIIVGQVVPLSESDFAQLQITGGAKPDDWFPVFLKGKENRATQPSLAVGSCGGSASASRMEEGYEIEFQRSGAERNLDSQTAGDVSAGPGSGGWRILLGFVKWDKTKNAFTGLKSEGRKYVGVQADEVAARGGSLTFRTRTQSQANKPAIVLDETDDGLVQFGALDSSGIIVPVFTLNAKGDIETEGKIKAKGTIIGALSKGVTQVESGIATDGMILPLPPGVTEKQVADGEAVIQTQISLHFTGKTIPPGSSSTTEEWISSPLESWVDASRRVHCRVRWQQIVGGTAVEDHPAPCRYVVLASLKEKQA